MIRDGESEPRKRELKYRPAVGRFNGTRFLTLNHTSLSLVFFAFSTHTERGSSVCCLSATNQVKTNHRRTGSLKKTPTPLWRQINTQVRREGQSTPIRDGEGAPNCVKLRNGRFIRSPQNSKRNTSTPGNRSTQSEEQWKEPGRSRGFGLCNSAASSNGALGVLRGTSSDWLVLDTWERSLTCGWNLHTERRFKRRTVWEDANEFADFFGRCA